MLILKLPPFFPHCIAECKSAAISKQKLIWTPSRRSYTILALVLRSRLTQGLPFSMQFLFTFPKNVSKEGPREDRFCPLHAGRKSNMPSSVLLYVMYQ